MSPQSRLLRLPPSSRYAVSAALYLACLAEDEYHLVAEIAGRTGLSPSYLSKILQRLSRAGVLDSRRGAGGGYRLSRPAGEIAVSWIVAASRAGEPGATPCLIEARDCDLAAPCSMHRFAASTEASLLRQLEKTTLAHMAESLRPHSGQAGSGNRTRSKGAKDGME